MDDLELLCATVSEMLPTVILLVGMLFGLLMVAS